MKEEEIKINIIIMNAMKILSILSIIMILFGCRNENEPSKDVASRSKEKNNIFEYQVNFPDTVYVNRSYEGEISYKSPFDTITKKFSDPKQSRYVVFRTLPNKSYNFLRDFYVDSLKEYRIGAIDNRSIPFYDLSFKTTGTYEIKGLINDQILIDPNTKYNRDKNKIRLLEQDYPISFKVVAIDSTYSQ